MTSFYNDKRLNLGVFLQQTRILVRYYRESKLKVELEIRDTGSNPVTALAELENLKNAGITTVIGPMISEEALAVLHYANANGMLLLSPSDSV